MILLIVQMSMGLRSFQSKWLVLVVDTISYVETTTNIVVVPQVLRGI